jgi:hypothetical protein
VTVDCNTYIHAVLGPLTQRWVEIRNLTASTVDVYDLNGRHLCRAENQRTASDEILEDVRSSRAGRRRADRALQKRVTEAQEDELAAIHLQYQETGENFQDALDALRDAATDAALHPPIEKAVPRPEAGEAE